MSGKHWTQNCLWKKAGWCDWQCDCFYPKAGVESRFTRRKEILVGVLDFLPVSLTARLKVVPIRPFLWRNVVWDVMMVCKRGSLAWCQWPLTKNLVRKVVKKEETLTSKMFLTLPYSSLSVSVLDESVSTLFFESTSCLEWKYFLNKWGDLSSWVLLSFSSFVAANLDPWDGRDCEFLFRNSALFFHIDALSSLFFYHH